MRTKRLARMSRWQVRGKGPEAKAGVSGAGSTRLPGRCSLLALSAALSLLALSGVAEARPNVLLIVTDDQRAQGTMRAMPNVLRFFGRQGTQFPDAHATTPLCCPSRSSIFSGKYAHNHGVTINDGRLFDATDSWQRRLQQADYRTGIVGKYLNEVHASRAPFFDYRIERNPANRREPAAMTKDAIDFLRTSEARDRQPWALVASFSSPHEPWNVKPAGRCPRARKQTNPARSETDLSDKHPSIARLAKHYATLERPGPVEQGQLCELSATDEQIGGMVRLLSRLGEARRTFAIFTSDNGYHWGEHGLMRKGFPYRDSTHVPLYMRWPGRVSPGVADPRLAANIDIAPTIFQVTGLNPGYPVDGRSLLSRDTRSHLLIEHPTSFATHSPFAARLGSDDLYVEWDDGFVEDYAPGDRWQVEASNTPVPRDAAWLDAARACIGSSCP